MHAQHCVVAFGGDVLGTILKLTPKSVLIYISVSVQANIEAKSGVAAMHFQDFPAVPDDSTAPKVSATLEIPSTILFFESNVSKFVFFFSIKYEYDNAILFTTILYRHTFIH